MKTLVFSALMLAFTFGAMAQIQAPQPSPLGKLEQKVGLTDVTVEYSRPNMKGRTILATWYLSTKCGEPRPTKTPW